MGPASSASVNTFAPSVRYAELVVSSTSFTRRLESVSSQPERVRSAAQLRNAEEARPVTTGSYATRKTLLTECSVPYHAYSIGPLITPNTNIRTVRCQL